MLGRPASSSVGSTICVSMHLIGCHRNILIPFSLLMRPQQDAQAGFREEEAPLLDKSDVATGAPQANGGGSQPEELATASSSEPEAAAPGLEACPSGVGTGEHSTSVVLTGRFAGLWCAVVHLWHGACREVGAGLLMV